MVCVDGIWYHVDVTWDDQPHLGNGIVYNYFLKSSDYFLKNSHLWDDREDGFGTPYPEAKRNNGNAPGASGSDNITRPIEGEKPKVVERAIGLESSVPEPIELSVSSAEDPVESSVSSDGSGEDVSSSASPWLFVIAGAVFCAAVAVVAVVVANGKKKRSAAEAPQPEQAPPKRDDVYDSYDSYDGFDS